MKEMSDTEVTQFVEQQFGAELAKKLTNIGRGGKNNKKGSDFENFFAANKICLIASSVEAREYGDYHITCQETAFVDDLCVRHLSAAQKTNYQAKNSDGDPASWDEEMQCRFGMQQIIDHDLHLSKISTQVLLVSSIDKAAANDAKIPADMKDYCLSEHFPYHTSSTQLVIGHSPLREALNKLCATQSLSNVDAAFRLVLGQWCADNEHGRTVLDVMTKAKAMSHPDVFASFVPNGIEEEEVGVVTVKNLQESDAPTWLTDLLAAFQMPSVTVECGAFIVSYNGMQARVTSSIASPSPQALAKLKKPGDIVVFLMSLEAETLDDHLPTGENRQ